MATDDWGPYFALGATALGLAILLFTFFNVIWTPQGLTTGPQEGNIGTMSMLFTQVRVLLYALLQLFILVPFALWSWSVVAWSHFTGNWRIYAFFAVISSVSLGANHCSPQLLRAIDDMYNCGIDTVLKDFVSPIANATAEAFDVGICWYDATWAIMFSSVTIGTRELVDCGEQINWRLVLEEALEVPVVTARAWDDWVNRLIDNRDAPAVDVDAAISIEAATNATATIVPAANCLCEDIDFIWNGIQKVLNSTNLKYAIDNGTNVLTSAVRTTIRSITNENGRPVDMFMPSADRLNRTFLHIGAWFDDIDSFAFDIFACTFAETIGTIDDIDRRLEKFFNISSCTEVEVPRVWSVAGAYYGIYAYAGEIIADTIFHADEVFQNPILYLANINLEPIFDQGQFTAQKIEDVFDVNVFNCPHCQAADAVGGAFGHGFNATVLGIKAVAQISQYLFNLTSNFTIEDAERAIPGVYEFALNYDYGPINNELREVCTSLSFIGAQIEPHLGFAVGNFCTGGVLLANATASIVLNITGVFEDPEFLIDLPVQQAAFEIDTGWEEFAEFFFTGATDSRTGNCSRSFEDKTINEGVLPANFFCCIGTLVDGLGEALTQGLLFIWELAIDVVEITICAAQIIICEDPDRCIPGFCRTTQDLDDLVLPALMDLQQILYNSTDPPPGRPRGGIMPGITRAADSIGCLTALPFSRVPCPSDLFHDGNLEKDKYMFNSVADMISEFLNLTNVVLNAVNVTIDLGIIFFETEITDITFCVNGTGKNTDSLECNLIRAFGMLIQGTVDPLFNAVRAIARFLGCLVGKQVQQVINFLANTLQEFVDASFSNILQMTFNFYAAIYDFITFNLQNFICDLEQLVDEVLAFIEQIGCSIPIVSDIINFIFGTISCIIGDSFCAAMCAASTVPGLDILAFAFDLHDTCDCNPFHDFGWKACNTKTCNSDTSRVSCLESGESMEMRNVKRAEIRRVAVEAVLGKSWFSEEERFTPSTLTAQKMMNYIIDKEKTENPSPCDIRLHQFAPYLKQSLASIGKQFQNGSTIVLKDETEAYNYALQLSSQGQELELAEIRDCALRFSTAVLLNNIGLLGSQPLMKEDFFYDFKRPFLALGEFISSFPVLLSKEKDRLPRNGEKWSKKESAQALMGQDVLHQTFEATGVQDPTTKAALTIIDYLFREIGSTVYHDGKPRLKTHEHARIQNGDPSSPYYHQLDVPHDDKYFWNRRKQIVQWYVPTEKERRDLGLNNMEEGIRKIMKPVFIPEEEDLPRTLEAYYLLVTGVHTKNAAYRRRKLFNIYNRVQERIRWHYLSPKEQLEVATKEMEMRYERYLRDLESAPRNERGKLLHPRDVAKYHQRQRRGDDDKVPAGCANFSCGFDCCENCVLVEKIVNYAVDMWCDCIQYARFKTICPSNSTNCTSSSSSSSASVRQKRGEILIETEDEDYNWNVILDKRKPEKRHRWPPPRIDPPPPRTSYHWSWHDIKLHDRAIQTYVEHGFNPPDLVYEHHKAYGYGSENAKKWYHPKRPLTGSQQQQTVMRGRSRRGNTYDADEEPYCCAFTSEPIEGETSISSVNFSITALTIKWVEALINIPYKLARSILINTGVIESASIGETLALVAAIDSAATWIVNTNTEEDAVDEDGDAIGFGLFASYAFYYGCDYTDNFRCHDQGHGLFPDGALWVTGVYIAGSATIYLVFPTFSWLISYAWVTWPGSMWLVAYGISPSCFPTIPACVADDINDQVQTMTGDCINWDTVFPGLKIPGTGECGECNNPAQFLDCNTLGFNDAFGMLFFMIQWLQPEVNDYLRTTGAPWFAWVTDIPAFRRKLEVFDFSGDPPEVLLSCFKYGLMTADWSVLIWYTVVGGFATLLLLYILLYAIILFSQMLTAIILILIDIIDLASGSNEQVARPNQEEMLKQEKAIRQGNQTGASSPAQAEIQFQREVSQTVPPLSVPSGNINQQEQQSYFSRQGLTDRVKKIHYFMTQPHALLDVSELPPNSQVIFNSDEEQEDEESDDDERYIYYSESEDEEQDEVAIERREINYSSPSPPTQTNLRRRKVSRVPGLLARR